MKSTLLYKQKRGTILDLLPLGLILFTLAITIILSYGMYDKILASGSLNTTAASTNIGNIILPQFSVWDNIFLAAFIGLSLTSIIAAAQLRTSPLFFFVSLILYTVVLIIGYVEQSTYAALSNQSFFAAYSPAFPKISFIMQHLVLLMMIMGTILTIAIYSTRGQESFS